MRSTSQDNQVCILYLSVYYVYQIRWAENRTQWPFYSECQLVCYPTHATPQQDKAWSPDPWSYLGLHCSWNRPYSSIQGPTLAMFLQVYNIDIISWLNLSQSRWLELSLRF